MPPSPAPSTLTLRLEQACLSLLALIVVSTPLFFYTQTQDQFELPKVVLFRILTSLLLGAALSWRLLKPQAWRRTPLDLPLLAFSAWLGVKTLFSVSPALSWRGEYENFAGSLTQLNYSVLFYMSAQVVSTWGRARALTLALLSGAIGAAFYGLLQASQRDFIAWASESFISNRFFGSLGNPNFLAGLACMAIPLKLALSWEEQRGERPARDWSWWARLGLLLVGFITYLLTNKLDKLQLFSARPGEDLGARVVLLLWLLSFALSWLLWRAGKWRWALGLGQAADLLLLFKALANTGTRGAFLGLMAGMAVMALGWLRLEAKGRSVGSLLPRLGLIAGAVLLLLSVAFMGLGPAFRERVAITLKDPSYAIEASRLQIWGPALRIWKANPWTGTGVDTFKSVFPSYSTSRFNKYDGDNVSSRMAHCEPLQILATMGGIGLALWLILCAALFAAWWRRLRTAEGAGFLVLGLGAFCAAYLGQNLVSFGVVGISAPFFLAAALLFGGDAAREESVGPPLLSPVPAVLAGIAVAALGGQLAWRTLEADLDYAISFQIHRQLQSSATASSQDALSMGAYAIQQLQAYGPELNKDVQDERALWLPSLQDAAGQLQAHPEAEAQLRPVILQGSSCLLYALAAQKMENATGLCPDEVKYQVYLGLSYEELFKHSQPQRRQLWFEKTRAAYERSVLMNPQNAYYHGNLGRLFGMGAEAGSADFLPEAAHHYEDAIRIAPVTRLFYENLLLLYARYAKVAEAGALMDSLQARDPEIAPSILMAAASTFYQWSLSQQPAWTPALRKSAQPVFLAWAHRAVNLAPKEFTDPRDRKAFSDYALNLAELEDTCGHRSEAKMALALALEWEADNKEAAAYKAKSKL